MPMEIKNLSESRRDTIIDGILRELAIRSAHDVYWSMNQIINQFYRYNKSDVTYRRLEFRNAVKKLVSQEKLKLHLVDGEVYYTFK